jgi:hypothetical protein
MARTTANVMSIGSNILPESLEYYERESPDAREYEGKSARQITRDILAREGSNGGDRTMGMRGFRNAHRRRVLPLP